MSRFRCDSVQSPNTTTTAEQSTLSRAEPHVTLIAAVLNAPASLTHISQLDSICGLDTVCWESHRNPSRSPTAAHERRPSQNTRPLTRKSPGRHTLKIMLFTQKTAQHHFYFLDVMVGNKHKQTDKYSRNWDSSGANRPTHTIRIIIQYAL